MEIFSGLLDAFDCITALDKHVGHTVLANQMTRADDHQGFAATSRRSTGAKREPPRTVLSYMNGTVAQDRKAVHSRSLTSDHRHLLRCLNVPEKQHQQPLAWEFGSVLEDVGTAWLLARKFAGRCQKKNHRLLAKIVGCGEQNVTVVLSHSVPTSTIPVQ